MTGKTGGGDWVERLRIAEALPADYRLAVHDFVAPLARRIQSLRERVGRAIIIGINGAQGSGKSTFALFLANWLERELGAATARLSLDDLYLTKAERNELARHVHPLFATRGVPGTHDLALGGRVLDSLINAQHPGSFAVPVFDKALDDRAAESSWPVVDAPVDVVLFEGWCVGALPQGDGELRKPINALEATEDDQGIWRRRVNRSLESEYADFFGRLDALIMLRIPSFEKVSEWRQLQEDKLRAQYAGGSPGDKAASRGQTDAELERFIQHYERLTRHMLASMPGHADTVIAIDSDHRITSMTHRGRL